jgi:hypothetical protein
MYEDLDLTLDDVLTEEELESLREEAYERYYNASLSSDSLGLFDRDF